MTREDIQTTLKTIAKVITDQPTLALTGKLAKILHILMKHAQTMEPMVSFIEIYFIHSILTNLNFTDSYSQGYNSQSGYY
jgi:hypothetical protein